jgi:hypothetical protein
MDAAGASGLVQQLAELLVTIKVSAGTCPLGRGGRTMFEPGANVVCTDDTFPDGIRDVFNALPRKGATYVVRDLVPGIGWKMNEEPAVYLEELVNLPNEKGTEPGFACRRFRELEEVTETEYVDVSVPVEYEPRIHKTNRGV